MKFSIKKLAANAVAGVSASLALASSALAASDLAEAGKLKFASGSLYSIIIKIVDAALWGIGILAVLYLVYGGVLYVTAGGDAEKAGKGRTAITNAIIGIIIIALALAIVKFVIAVPELSGGYETH